MAEVVVVTGGSRGIRRATARLAAERGYAVAVNYLRDQAAADALVSELRELGASALGVGGCHRNASGGDPDRPERLRSVLPWGRAGLPEEVARAVLWLASPEASYCAGTILEVGGGR